MILGKSEKLCLYKKYTKRIRNPSKYIKVNAMMIGVSSELALSEILVNNVVNKAVTLRKS